MTKPTLFYYFLNILCAQIFTVNSTLPTSLLLAKWPSRKPTHLAIEHTITCAKRQTPNAKDSIRLDNARQNNVQQNNVQQNSSGPTNLSV